MHTNRKHLVPEVREIFEPSNHAAYTVRTKLVAEVREMFEPGVTEQVGADTRRYAALLSALDEAIDRGDRLREYVAQMDIAIQEDEGEGNDDLGTLESVRRVLRERAEVKARLASAEASLTKAQDELDAYKKYIQQLRDRIVRGNEIAQRREDELAKIASLRVPQGIDENVVSLLTKELAEWRGWDQAHHKGVRHYVAALEQSAREMVSREQEAAEHAHCVEAQLAALREAATETSEALSEYYDPHDPDIYCSWELKKALADTAAAVEAHDRRVRAEALREAAEAVGHRSDGVGMGVGPHSAIESWLRARADEIERGGR